MMVNHKFGKGPNSAAALLCTSTIVADVSEDVEYIVTLPHARTKRDIDREKWD